MVNKEELEKIEYETLAPYAMKSGDSRGRDFDIEPDALRTEFQRDRDRIIHSTAFRRLEYKTQVFMIHEGDYFRTRLTHTMEVAQIARTMARSLRLNVDLAEAIALAHDIGHTPYGHSGEMALNRLMQDSGGFEHNEQGLRVVEYLEERYPDIHGLNLTWEVREGIIKHHTEYDSPQIEERFEPKMCPTLEAQIVEPADEIAYNNHDLDDALQMGLIKEKDLKAVPWCWEIFQEARRSLPGDAREKFVKYRTIGTIIDIQVSDVLEQTERNITEQGINGVEAVRRAGARLAGFSPPMAKKNKLLKDFLMHNVYTHPQVVRMTRKAESYVERLFKAYLEAPQQLPRKYQNRINKEGLKRVICDYISGMTDRYLLEEYIKTFEPQMII